MANTLEFLAITIIRIKKLQLKEETYPSSTITLQLKALYNLANTLIELYEQEEKKALKTTHFNFCNN